MRRLVLMRHAKTEANNPEGDKARHLMPRGVQDAQNAGKELAELSELPEPPQGWSAELPTLMREEIELRVKEEASSALLARLAHEIEELAPDRAALERAEDFRRLMLSSGILASSVP